MDIFSQKAFSRTVIPVVAGEDIYYPSLAAMASQYQFYRFKGLGLEYTPVVGASTNGQIAFAPVATYADYLSINSWDDIIGLPQASVSNIWQSMEVQIPMDMLNRQVNEGWRAIIPSSSIDYSDVTQCQGFIAVAVQGCANTDLTNVIGRVSVSYDALLFKARVTGVTTDAVVWQSSNAHLSNANITRGASRVAYLTETSVKSWTVQMAGCIPALVMFHSDGNQGAGPTVTLASPDDGVVEVFYYTYDANGCFIVARVTPTRRGVVYTVHTNVAPAGDVVLVHHYSRLRGNLLS